MTCYHTQSHYPFTGSTSPSSTPLSLSAKRGAISTISNDFGMSRPGIKPAILKVATYMLQYTTNQGGRLCGCVRISAMELIVLPAAHWDIVTHWASVWKAVRLCMFVTSAVAGLMMSELPVMAAGVAEVGNQRICWYNHFGEDKTRFVSKRWLLYVPEMETMYRNGPKFSDRYAWANSADPDQRSSLIWVYTVCHSVCIVWTHCSRVEPHSSNFGTTNVLGVQIFRKFTTADIYFHDTSLNVC